MTDQMKKICELRKQLSFIEFGESLSGDDRRIIREIKQEIAELEKTVEGVAVKLSHKQYKSMEFYLTDDPDLCCCDEPTYFESQEEADEHLNRAKLKKEDYNITYERMPLQVM